MAEESKPQQERKKEERTTAKVVADTLVREPLMITLPLAIGLSTVLWKLPDLPKWSDSNMGALGASLVISILVWVADVSTSPPEAWKSFTPWARFLVYVTFNTLLVAGVLTDFISIEATGLSINQTNPGGQTSP